MPEYVEAKQKPMFAKTPKRKCPVCGASKELKDFYQNKEWVENDCRDKWCIDCFKDLKTKAEFKQYFWENNREWSDDIWQKAEESAKKKLEATVQYKKGNDTRRKTLLARETAALMPNFINHMYKYRPKTKDEAMMTYEDAVDAGLISPDKDNDDPNAKEYSEFFNGYFTQRELEYLENYYRNLKADEFEDESQRDYGRKAAKASLNLDKTMDDYRNGRCGIDAVKDATAVFDTISKSGNFAACKRVKKNDESKTSWSEISMYLITHGKPYTRKIEWPKDDVDKTIEEFRFITSALGLDQV